MFKKTCQIAAASLAVVEAKRCNQYHSFAAGPYDGALVMGVSGEGQVTSGGHQFDSEGGNTRAPLSFDEDQYWCQTYNLRNADKDHFGIWNHVNYEELGLNPDEGTVYYGNHWAKA